VGHNNVEIEIISWDLRKSSWPFLLFSPFSIWINIRHCPFVNTILVMDEVYNINIKLIVNFITLVIYRRWIAKVRKYRQLKSDKIKR
jgi:hypothetical protein